MKKALPFSKELSVSCLWKEQYPGGGRLMWADGGSCQPWLHSPGHGGAVGSGEFGAQLMGPRPGMLFPRLVLISVVEVWWAHPSMSLLLQQGGVFALRQNVLHCGGSLWPLQQHYSDYKELHRAKINHILHWLMSPWEGMASLPANLWLLIDKMHAYMVRVYSWKTKQKSSSIPCRKKKNRWMTQTQSCRMKSSCCFYLLLITFYPNSPVLSHTLCTWNSSAGCCRVSCKVSCDALATPEIPSNTLP